MADIPMVLRLIWYNADQMEEQTLSDPAAVAGYLQRPGVVWLHVQGEAMATLLPALTEVLHLHPLAVEDVLSGRHRPKAEEYEHQDFILTQHVSETADYHVAFQQLSLFVGPNYLLSCHNGSQDLLEPVRTRLRPPHVTMRQHGVDYLMYALLDQALDGYFPVLEDFGEYLEYLQDEALLSRTPQVLPAIQNAKHELLALRRAIWPQREILNVLLRDDNDSVTGPVKHYLRDCYDHVVMLIDTVETYREMTSDLMEAYMTAVSNRLNAVMKVLTVIATIFMPLTFLVGVYGMNFHTDVSPYNMPELTWKYGYLACWGTMGGLVVMMLVYFRRLGWIGPEDLRQPPPAAGASRWRDRARTSPRLLTRLTRLPRRPTSRPVPAEPHE